MPRIMDKYMWANIGDSFNMSDPPPLKMRGVARLYIPFGECFQMGVVYTTTRKYITDRKEKQLIWMYQSEPLKS